MNDQPTTPDVRPPTVVSNTDTVRAHATRLLEALGDDPLHVFHALLAGRHYGTPNSEEDCPFANFLLRELADDGVSHVAVIGNIAVFEIGGREAGIGDYVDMPDACEEVVYRFDNGEYPALNKVVHAAQMAAMTDLVNKVVAHYAEELTAAGSDAELGYLAQRAEAQFCTDLGDRMRACVDYERARRTITAGIGGARHV
jgi:hypothetical protein